MFHRILATFAVAVFSIAVPTVGSAQSVTFLHADGYEKAAGQRLALRFDRWADDGAVGSPWPAGFDWFFVRAAGGQDNLQARGPVRATTGTLEIPLPEPGIALVASDREPRVESASAGELRSFLRTRLGSHTLPSGWKGGLGREDVRIRRLESSKLLVRVVGDDGWFPTSATAQSKTGQRAEIRPLGDPTSAREKSDLPLRVYLPGGSRAGVRVLARHVSSGRTQSFLTDSVGAGYFTISEAGVWVVEAHHARPLEGDPDEVDWEVTTATLTFEVPVWDPREGDDR